MTAPRFRPANAEQLRTLRRHPAGRPDPERMIVAVVRAYLEVEAGRRPLEQLEPALSPTVGERLARTLRQRREDARAVGLPRVAVGPGPRSVRSLQVTRPAEDVLEAAVAVEVGERTTAVCVRLEAWRTGWRVTELARPDDGLDPLPSRRRSPPAGPGPRRIVDTVDDGDVVGDVIDLDEARAAAERATRRGTS